MDTIEINLDSCNPGEKQVLRHHIALLPGGDRLSLTVLVARGKVAGPTIAVLGGVHGDEYEGPWAIRNVFQCLDPAEMKGMFIAVPQSNPPAFAVNNRASPIDGLNLARVFPGKASGTVTERIAFFIDSQVIARSEMLVDLHSSGNRLTSPTLVGYHEVETEAGRRSQDAAEVFGAPVIWAHPSIAPGRSMSSAEERGVPSIYTECAGGAWLNREIAALYAVGVRNVMERMGILRGEIDHRATSRRLRCSGTVEEMLACNVGGFIVAEVKPLDRVHKGDILARMYDEAGQVLEELKADMDGIAVYVVATPSVTPGDMCVMLSQEM